MSISSEISRIAANVAAAFSAITTKGGTVPSTHSSDDLAEAISSIPGGAYNIRSINNGDGTQNLVITDAGGVTPPSTGKAAQASDYMARVNSTSMTSTTVSLTVEKTGYYTVRWSGYRSSTSGTNSSQLYIGNTAYGTEQSTFSVNSNGQTVKLNSVYLEEGETITVRARARGTSYYMWVMGLSIIEEE